MRRTKMAYDRRIKSMLCDVFHDTPRAPNNTAQDAAQSAYAMLNGLLSSSFFDKSLSAEESRRLFRLTLYRLAGLRPTRSRQLKN